MNISSVFSFLEISVLLFFKNFVVHLLFGKFNSIILVIFIMVMILILFVTFVSFLTLRRWSAAHSLDSFEIQNQKKSHRSAVASKLIPATLLRPKMIEELPFDLLGVIISYLPCKETLLIQRTSKTLKKAATDQSALSSIEFRSSADLEWFKIIKKYQYNGIKSLTIHPKPARLQKQILSQLFYSENTRFLDTTKIRCLHLINICLIPDTIRLINNCINVQILTLIINARKWESVWNTPRMTTTRSYYRDSYKHNAHTLEKVKQLQKHNKVKSFKTCIATRTDDKPNVDWLRYLITNKLELTRLENVILHDYIEVKRIIGYREGFQLYENDIWQRNTLIRRHCVHPKKGVFEDQLISLVDLLNKYDNIEHGYFQRLRLNFKFPHLSRLLCRKEWDLLKLFEIIWKLMVNSKDKKIENIEIQIWDQRFEEFHDKKSPARIDISQTREYFLLAMQYLQQVCEHVKTTGNGEHDSEDNICPLVEKIVIKTCYPDTPSSVLKDNNNNNNGDNYKLQFENKSIIPWSQLMIEMIKWQSKLHHEKIVTIEKLDVHFQCLDKQFGADPEQCVSIGRDIDKVLTTCMDDFGMSSCTMSLLNPDQKLDDNNVYLFESRLISPSSKMITSKNSDKTAIKIQDEYQHQFVNRVLNQRLLLLCINRVFMIITLFGLTYSMRFAAFILFTRTFYANNTLGNIFVYLAYVLFVVGLFACGVFGNKWKFFDLLFIALVIDTMSFILFEEITVIFLQFCIADAVGDQPFRVINYAWDNKILAKKYTLAQAFFLGIICGPVIGHMLAAFCGYGLVFRASDICVCVLLYTYLRVYVLVTQKKFWWMNMK